MAAQPLACGWSDIVRKQVAPKHQEGLDDRVLESFKSSKGISIAIVDANAVIQGGEQLTSCAEKFVSVAEVLQEVKDPVSRHTLAFVPFTVETMDPSEESLKKVIDFARATGDLQTLSDVDLKLIALTYTLEAQIHGTDHLRDTPPPLRVLRVKRLPEKDMPGWGFNVPNLAEWEALEHTIEADMNVDSRILLLKDLALNRFPMDSRIGSRDNLMENVDEAQAEHQEDHCSRKPRRSFPSKREINIEGKKMVVDGIDASQGETNGDPAEWQLAVSRSTHRRYLRRQERRVLSVATEESKQPDTEENTDKRTTENEAPSHMSSERANIDNGTLNEDEGNEENIHDGEAGVCDGNVAANFGNLNLEGDEVESLTDKSVDTSLVDDSNSEQSWMLQSLSDSSVACVTSDFAMQNVLLQMGLRILTCGGKQIRQLHRWVLKCHACNRVTAEIGRIFCPKCGNGGTLRKVSVTVGENGIVQAARRPRITIRGTKFSLPQPQGGRDAITKNLILREDQLPHKLLYPKLKKHNNPGMDILSLDEMSFHSADRRAPLKPPIRKALAVFSGKRNPNDNHFSRCRR